MPIPFFPFLFRRHKPAPRKAPQSPSNTPVETTSPAPHPRTSHQGHFNGVRRYFYNERGFQTYASFFAHWGGYITAGHVLTDAQEKIPPFCGGSIESWPDGLDAAIIGCTLPNNPPKAPVSGQDVICVGYPAGSNVQSARTGKVYIQRPSAPDTWIIHIIDPDEPVVTGMSGGAVLDARTKQPIGIIITRNSPADLNNDRDPDESCDFVSLSGVWNAVNKNGQFV